MFELPDPLFISAAFLKVLGRPVDPKGLLEYQSALEHGLGRVALILDLQRAAPASVDRQAEGVQPSLPVDLTRLWQPRWGSALTGLRGTRAQQLALLPDALLLEAAFVTCHGRLWTRPEERDWRQRWHSGGRTAVLTCWRRTRWTDPRNWLPRRPATWWRHHWPGPKTAPAARPAVSARPQPADEPIPTPATWSAAATVVFTIATRSYLSFARRLMNSVQSVHPDWGRVVVVVDGSGPPQMDDTGLLHLPAIRLGLPLFDDMRVRYDVVELATALKPFVFQWLMGQAAVERAMYLDPDILVLKPLRPVESAWQAGHAMVLTPHITAPLLDNCEPSDHTLLKSGVFNLGFMAIARHPEAEAFLSWWADKLQTGALVAFEQNLFTDQRWCDMAPAFVPSLLILRHAGCNLAYWNLTQRPVHLNTCGELATSDGPLLFFHFSGFDPEQPNTLSKYQDRLTWDDIAQLQGLLHSYAQELLALDWHGTRRLAYGYATFEGLPLPPALRSLYRKRHPSPWQTDSATLANDLLSAVRPGSPSESKDAPLSALMRHVHELDTEARCTFDLNRPDGRIAFARWFWAAGVVRHGLLSLYQVVSEREAPLDQDH